MVDTIGNFKWLLPISFGHVIIFEELKEQCYEDFPFLGQFCAKIITLRV